MDVHARPADPEIDLLTAPALARSLADLDARDDVLVDLSTVTFCDARGMRVLWHEWHRHTDAGGSFRLAGARPALGDLLTLVGMADALQSEDAAA
jgi:anti-anti-sigma factor